MTIGNPYGLGLGTTDYSDPMLAFQRTPYDYTQSTANPYGLGQATPINAVPDQPPVQRTGFQQSDTARNIALAGAGLQALGGIGQVIFGGRQTRAQQKENARAIGKANLISILTGNNISPNPSAVSSTGNRTSQLLANVGSSLTSLGTQVQSYRDSEYKLKLADEAAELAAKRARRDEDIYARQRRADERSRAMTEGQLAATNAIAGFASGNGGAYGALSNEETEKLMKDYGVKRLYRDSLTKEAVMPALMQAIAMQETGSDYSEAERYDAGNEGAVIKGIALPDTSIFAGETAVGKYQIMPSNVKAWSKKHLGFELTPQDLYDRPALQEQIAYMEISEYFDKALEMGANVEDAIGMAATAWHAGPGKMATWKETTVKDQGTGLATTDYAARAISDTQEILGRPDLATQSEFIAPDVFQEIQDNERLKKSINPEALNHLVSNLSPELGDYYRGGYLTEINKYMTTMNAEVRASVKEYNSLAAAEAELDLARRAELRQIGIAYARKVGANAEASREILKTGQEVYEQTWADIKDLEPMEKFMDLASNYAKLIGTIDDFAFLAAKGERVTINSEHNFTAVEHITMINTFQRLIDEATVREGDVQLYMDKTSGSYGGFMVRLQNVLEGAVITTETIEDMRNVAQALVKGSASHAFAVADAELTETMRMYQGVKGSPLSGMFKDMVPENFSMFLKRGIESKLKAAFKIAEEDFRGESTSDELDWIVTGELRKLIDEKFILDANEEERKASQARNDKAREFEAEYEEWQTGKNAQLDENLEILLDVPDVYKEQAEALGPSLRHSVFEMDPLKGPSGDYAYAEPRPGDPGYIQYQNSLVPGRALNQLGQLGAWGGRKLDIGIQALANQPYRPLRGVN